jgi:hypothetical protein
MNIITHALAGWGLATAIPNLKRHEKGWVVAASIAPDLDGLGILVEIPTRNTQSPLYWWSEYHHLLAHNALFSVLLTVVAGLLTRHVMVAAGVFVGINLHYLCDLAGSRGPDGYQWPLHYLWPFSEQPALAVPWQWQLNSWQNVTISLVLLAYVFWLARSQGNSPLELVSLPANDRFVATLRSRFPLDQKASAPAGSGSPDPSRQRKPRG